jgi:isocitrate dehydrogenase
MKTITVAKGDGIGPEIMDATIEIILAAGAQINIEEIEVGEKVYLAGNTSGIAHESWDIIRKNKVFLKAPITTPQGGGYKSLNVTTRKFLGLYANIRPCMSLHPFVKTKHPIMDIVIVRENEEDLYAGIEHQQTDEVVQCLKLISRPGCEKIVRYAFEYAKQYGRKKVTCFTKDNIMKFSDGLFTRIFQEVAKDYPEIENEHWIVDIGAAKLADSPEAFDVVVLPNLYGDILSDVAAQIAGSVGLAGSSNIGENFAMFEAIHGSAPRRAGQNLANPSGLLLGGVLMLLHLDLHEAAEKVHNAWLKTLEDGIHTYDVYTEGLSTEKVGTSEFGDAVVARMGQRPVKLTPVDYKAAEAAGKGPAHNTWPAEKKELVGIDLFLDWTGGSPDTLGAKMKTLDGEGLSLNVISNRGQKVFPDGAPETFCSDHWRCRYLGNGAITPQQAIALQSRAAEAGLDLIKTENLYTFNGERGYTLDQGA